LVVIPSAARDLLVDEKQHPLRGYPLVATLLGMTIALCPASPAFKQFQACSNTELSTLIARTVAAIPRFHEEPNSGMRAALACYQHRETFY